MYGTKPPPSTAAVRNAEGARLWGAGHQQDAIAAFVHAVELRADFAEGWCNLAAAAATIGDNRQALQLFQHAVTLDPTLVQAHMGLGGLAERCGQLEVSATWYRRAFALNSAGSETRLALGSALARVGDAAGMAMLEELVAEEPDSAEAHFSLALSLLLHGRYQRGWQEHEWRVRLARMPTCQRSFPEPRWHGEPLDGRSILLYTEQGFGDTLQFVRYAPLVAARGGRVILEAQPGLRRLLSEHPGVAECVAKGVWEAPGAPRPRFSVYAPLLSLPLLFGTQLESIPPPVTPAVPSPGKRRRDGLQVGLVWAGDLRHHHNHLRSISLEEWRPLAGVEGAVFTSLQKGSAEAELAVHGADFRFVERCADVHDFADTAAILAELDLVITVDTAVAHLAGTLGKPVWLLLHPMVDWRWGLTGTTTPWYPTARLFRRKSTSDNWATVFGDVADALRQLVAEKSADEVLSRT